MITTGARRDRVPAAFEPVVDAVVTEVADADPGAELHLYGSVATGQARVGASDVDLLTIGLDPATADDIGMRLSERFSDVCRGVEVGAASSVGLEGDHDEAYGLRAFLRHYCVHLAGPNELCPSRDYPADERAARGLNGDIARHLERWRAECDGPDAIDHDALATRIARKTLLAVAGLVSMHDATWTTDRERATARWSDVHPELTAGLDRLLDWTGGATGVTRADIAQAIDQTVQPVADQFAARIGLWP